MDSHFKKTEFVNAAIVVNDDQFGGKENVAETNAWASEGTESRSLSCSVGALVARAMFDSGADQSLTCPTLLKRLEEAGCWVDIDN